MKGIESPDSAALEEMILPKVGWNRRICSFLIRSIILLSYQPFLRAGRRNAFVPACFVFLLCRKTSSDFVLNSIIQICSPPLSGFSFRCPPTDPIKNSKIVRFPLVIFRFMRYNRLYDTHLRFITQTEIRRIRSWNPLFIVYVPSWGRGGSAG